MLSGRHLIFSRTGSHCPASGTVSAPFPSHFPAKEEKNRDKINPPFIILREYFSRNLWRISRIKVKFCNFSPRTFPAFSAGRSLSASRPSKEDFYKKNLELLWSIFYSRQKELSKGNKKISYEENDLQKTKWRGWQNWTQTIGMTLMTEQNTKDKDARMTDRNYTNTNSRQNTNRQTGQDKARPRQTSIQQIYKTVHQEQVLFFTSKKLIQKLWYFELKCSFLKINKLSIDHCNLQLNLIKFVKN